MATVHPLITELRQIRIERGVSQPTLAAWLGVAVVTFKSWEAGRREPRDLADLERWAAMLGRRPALIELHEGVPQ